VNRKEGRGLVLVLLGLTLGVAGLVRLAWLGRDGLWLDEASVAKAASASLPRLVAEAKLDNQPPGFHLAVAAVTRALGDGEWQMRLVSALAGLATVALVYETGASVFNPTAGLLAALLLALSPMGVHYSREARPYALLALCGLVAFRSALALERRPTSLRATLVAVSLVAVLYVHATAAFIVATLAATFLVRALGAAGGQRPWLLRAWFAILATATFAYLPWLAALRQQTAEIGGSYAWALERWRNWFPWQLPASAGALSPGSLPPFYNNLTSLSATAWIGAALMLLLGAGALARRHTFSWPAAPVVCAILTTLPLALLFAASLVAQPVYTVGRVEMLVQPFALLLAGAGLAGLPARLRPLVPVLVVGLAWPALELEIRSGYRSTERSLVETVARDSRPGDAVVVTGPLRHVFEYYLGRWKSGLAIESWPARRAAHPHWVDWSREDPAALAEEARGLTARLGREATESGTGHAWLVLMEEGGNGILAAEMERAFPRDARLEQPGWHLELRRYRLAPVR
jgi:hypothetical protein